jgi:ATP-dependent helicase/nuclease subunit B
VITPRRTRLVRVPDLQAFRHAIVGLSLAGDRERLLSRVVLVPNDGAARQLRRTIGSAPMPTLATREEFYDVLHARLDSPPRRLTAYDRDVIVQSAARDANISLNFIPTRDGGSRLRPGLVAEMLRFYDQLRRQARNVARFEELLDESLSRDSEHDRGAGRMLAQARFFAETFHGYERRVEAGGACDEHGLRERLCARPSSNPIREVVVTVGDWIGDLNGLYLADFELLTRLPGLEAVDIVATTGMLESGFHQRIHEWLPGIEEVEGHAVSAVRPALAVPATDPDRPVFVHRDREEELIAIARRLKTGGGAPRAAVGRKAGALDRVAVVFKRPLPYLYLAREVFGAARLPYQAFDALPLAAEPFAAALDVVLEFVESGFTRGSMVALLRSPHFVFRHGDRPIDREEVASLDRVLSDERYLGGLERLQDVSAVLLDPEAAAEGPALQAVLGMVRSAAVALAPLLTAAPASSQFRCLIGFLDEYKAPIDENASRLRRGRAAVRDVLAALMAAHSAHDDPPMAIAELAASIRRWIEERTLVPDSPSTGVQFVDDQAARYGDFDEIAVVGLIEGEWPERPKQNIFYPASLLASLGWPTEKDRRGAAEARFLELLQSPIERVSVSTVSLDDEALVEASTFVEEIPRAKLPVTLVVPAIGATAPGAEDQEEDASDPDSRAWISMRTARSSRDAAAFHGQTDPLPQKTWSVSALETYLGCPFKFFAQHVLRLEEEPEDEEVMDPRTQGQFVHEVFEAFFRRWQHEGHQAITPDTIDTARTIFAEVVEEFLARLSDTEAALERTRLLGSPAAAGLGEAVFRMEAERAVPVVARLLEHRLTDEFDFETAAGPRRMSVNGKADRIDLLADGTFRVIDYKLGWPPNRARALQLPIYGLCAEQSLKGHLGRQWTLGEAAYLAFKGPKRVVGLFTSADERARVLTDAQQRFADTVDAINAGRFPPTPDDVYRCETCTYAAVCRKDYVGDV